MRVAGAPPAAGIASAICDTPQRSHRAKAPPADSMRAARLSWVEVPPSGRADDKTVLAECKMAPNGTTTKRPLRKEDICFKL